ncbi:MAG: tetratricopeptide repeat protein [Leptolyngbyaceae cyanobacterium RM1_406_9]|nr:tetratricopeptide repeat protein [Leptolyngbyaceae cyanobacterium RM1_406_9]
MKKPQFNQFVRANGRFKALRSATSPKKSQILPSPLQWTHRLVSLLLLACLSSTPLLALAIAPSPAQAQAVNATIRRAYTLLSQGLVDQAITAFQQAVRQNPQSVEAQLGLAIAYRRAGRDAEAFQAYEQVLTLDPSNRLALNTLGLLGGFRPEWQNRGIEALNTLLTIDPNDNQARAQRALLYSYQGRFAEAIADYEIVLQSNPTPDAVLGAAQVYTYTGDYRRGLELFNRYRASGQAISGNAAIAYALALQETGSPAEAIQVLEPQLRRSPQINRDTIQLRAALASAYAANRQFAEAEAAIDPLRGRGDSRLTLARALSVMGRYSGDTAYYTEAASLYRQVLATTSATPALVREAADVLSGVSSEQAYALQLYQQLTPQFPNDKGLLTQQLVLQSQLGQISRADLRQRLQAELQPLPGDRFQQQVIARSLLRIDSPDPELLPIYQSLLSAGINEPLLNFRVAQILIQRNDYAGARTALNAYSAAVGPADQSPNLLLAEIDRREGNLDSAAQRYESIIASNPADEGVLNGALQGLAGIRQAQGRVNEAIAFYDQLIARDPQNLTRQLGRASLAYQARLISEAEAQAVLSRWLQERPATDTPPELYNLVSVLPANAQRESLYLTLLEADPNNIPIQLRLVQVLAQRDPALARARVAELVARDPQNLSAYFVQGELAQQLGDLDLASESYETILSQEPNNTDALSALGGIRFQQRQYDSAAQLYNQVLSIRPDDPVAQTSLIALTAVQGRRLEALQRLEQIQVQQLAQGITDENLNQQMQLLEEGFLQQRGFQPPWERY